MGVCKKQHSYEVTLTSARAILYNICGPFVMECNKGSTTLIDYNMSIKKLTLIHLWGFGADPIESHNQDLPKNKPYVAE